MSTKNSIDLLVQDMSQATLTNKSPSMKSKINMNPWNFITASWMTPLFLKGARKTLVQEDLLDLPVQHKSDTLSNVMLPFWKRLKTNGGKSSPFKELFKEYYGTALGALLLQLVSAACSLAIPIFLEQIILFLTPNYSTDLLIIPNGYGLSFVLFGLQLLNVILGISSIQLMNILQIDIKTVLIGAVYEKSLRLKNSESGFTAGKILNIVNVDVEKLSQVFRNLNTLIVGPIQLVVCAILLGNLIGYAIWGSLSTLFAVLGLLTVGIKFLAQYQREFLKIGDKRLKYIREMLYGIKIIKLQNLEEYFFKQVSDIREAQLQVLKKYYYVNVFFIGLMQAIFSN